MKKNELKIKMIESYLSLHRQLNQLRLEYVSKKSTFTDEERMSFYEEVNQIKFNIKTREKVLPAMTS